MLALSEYNLHLLDARTREALDDDAGVVRVTTADSYAAMTCYSDKNGTSQSLPITMVNGRIRFFTAASVTSVDVYVQTDGGAFFYIRGLTPSQQHRYVDPEKDEYTMVIPYTIVGASETVTNTGFTIKANMLIRDALLHVHTVGTGAALEVGTSTDPDGFIDAASVATTGYPVTVTDEAIVSTSSLIGALLAVATGTYVRKWYRRASSTSGASIVYQNTTSSSTAGGGFIHLVYRRFRTTGGA